MKGKNTGNETVQAVIHVFMESHNETPCVAILNKQNVIFLTKTETRKAKQVLSGELVLRRGGVRKEL
jgi:hypothetical protein